MTDLALKNYIYAVPAGEDLVIPALGRSVSCVSSDLGSFELAVDDDSFLKFKEGYTATLPEGTPDFTSIRVRNNSVSTLNIELVIGRGILRDNRFVASGNVSVSIAVGEELDTPAHSSVADSTKTLIAAANTNRSYADIQNLEATGGDDVYIGGVNLASGRGIKVPAGQVYRIENNTAAIYAYHNKGSALSVAVVESQSN